MRLIFLGTRSLGAEGLEAIVEAGHDVVAVWAPKDGGQKVKEKALELGVFVTPWMGAKAVQVLRVDALVCMHNFEYVPGDVRAATRLGALAYHPSLLPRHRGRTSVEDTIAAGDELAGGSVYWMDDGYDTGPVVVQQSVAVQAGWTASDLWREELYGMGVRLMLQALRVVEVGAAGAKGLSQDILPWAVEGPDVWRVAGAA